MNAIVTWLELTFRAIPLPLLETWGRFGFIVGFALAVLAFGSFTLRLGEGWGLGRERQAWDAKAFLSMPLTFVIIVVTGYLGSAIVLVPGAQTFESLKDLSVFLCVVLFGYPALITIPFAYGLSDLVEGVPPQSLLDWLPGYFINPACFWVAYQLIGRDPDFRRAGTWLRYALFVASFMAIEPVLWGAICSVTFTPEIAYRNITPALFFTTAITWCIAPFAMLGAYPLARKLGLFWADIEGHVKERALGSQEWIWQAGAGSERPGESAMRGWPIRMFLLTPFIVLVLMMVAATAYTTLRSAEDDANRLAVRLHQEISENIDLRLDAYLARARGASPEQRARGLREILTQLHLSEHGRAFIVQRTGTMIASATSSDPVVQSAVSALNQQVGDLQTLRGALEFRFDQLSEKPLSRETWLARASAYRGRGDGHEDWIVVTAMPEAFYLAGVREGNSRSAMMFALALLLSLGVAAVLASMVTAPLRQLSSAAQSLARGDLMQRVPDSRLEELGSVARSFNDMAAQLSESFAKLLREVEVRKRRELELEQSESRVRTSENRLQLATRAAHLGIWDWDVARDELVWDDSMYQLYGVRREEFGGAFEAWSSCLAPEDVTRAADDVAAALSGEREFASEFRVRRRDGSERILRGVGQTIRDAEGRALRMVGINWDVTDQTAAERELRRHRDHLEELVEERTLALERSRQQADAANNAKSVFLANMSHEIRTPMNAILGFGQLLERQSDLSPRDRERIARIMSSGRHLLELINSVLEMSKIEAGRTTLAVTPFDLHALLDDLRLMFEDLSGDKAVSVSFTLDPNLPRALRGDAGKVRQILINLLSNASKFTQSGRIALLASGRAITSERYALAITVADTGAGIPPEQLERIFDAFDQAESGARAGGTGLGLTISRSFARLMGGDLTVESALGEGSAFTFTFEAAAAEPDELPAPDDGIVVLQLAADSRPPKALIVDDEPLNGELMQDVLSGVGFETRVATSGAEAIALNALFDPALVLMDLRMEGMDGLQAIRQLRADGCKAVIIAFTASALPESEPDARAAGADDFVRKPYRERDLLVRIAEALQLPYTVEPNVTRLRSSEPLGPELSQLVQGLPGELLAALREATLQARPERIESLSARAAQHSPAAADQIRALARRFQYDALLSALEEKRT